MGQVTRRMASLISGYSTHQYCSCRYLGKGSVSGFVRQIGDSPKCRWWNFVQILKKESTLRGGESATILIHEKRPKCLVITLDGTPLSKESTIFRMKSIGTSSSRHLGKGSDSDFVKTPPEGDLWCTPDTAGF